jgi:hypothetical protein
MNAINKILVRTVARCVETSKRVRWDITRMSSGRRFDPAPSSCRTTVARRCVHDPVGRCCAFRSSGECYRGRTGGARGLNSRRNAGAVTPYAAPAWGRLVLHLTMRCTDHPPLEQPHRTINTAASRRRTRFRAASQRGRHNNLSGCDTASTPSEFPIGPSRSPCRAGVFIITCSPADRGQMPRWRRADARVVRKAAAKTPAAQNDDIMTLGYFTIYRFESRVGGNVVCANACRLLRVK